MDEGVFWGGFLLLFDISLRPPRCWWQLAHIRSLVDAPLQDSAEGDLKPPWVAQTPHLCLPFCEEGKIQRVSHCLRQTHCVLWHHITAAPHQQHTGCMCLYWGWGGFGEGGGWKAWSKALPHTHRPCCVPSLPPWASPLASAAQRHLHACAKLSHPPAHLPPSSVP